MGLQSPQQMEGYAALGRYRRYVPTASSPGQVSLTWGGWVSRLPRFGGDRIDRRPKGVINVVTFALGPPRSDPKTSRRRADPGAAGAGVNKASLLELPETGGPDPYN